MKKIWSLTEIVDQYKNSCLVIKEATLSGNYKASNKENMKLIKIYKYLEQNIEVANKCLPLLFIDDNIVTRTKAAAHCLALRISQHEAEKILEAAASNRENGIFGFNAEMTLKVWHENGQLKVYIK